MWMEAEQTFLVFSDLFIISDCELFESFSGLDDIVDEMDVFVAFFDLRLEYADCQIEDDDRVVESDHAIDHMDGGHIPDDIDELEIY